MLHGRRNIRRNFCKKKSFNNSAVKNKNMQRSGNFWSCKFSVGQKRYNETCVLLGFSMVYLKWESKQ